ALAECDCRFVRLVARAHEPREPCGAAEDERQHAGGHRIERPRVADGALLQRSTHTDDDVMRRRPFRLVDDDEAVHYPPASIAASIRSMDIFSSAPSTVQPAAFLCPPPPYDFAIAPMSISPLDRMLTRYSSPSVCLKNTTARISFTVNGRLIRPSVSSYVPPAARAIS